MSWDVVSFWLPKALPVFGLAVMFILLFTGLNRAKVGENLEQKLGGVLLLLAGLILGAVIIALTR